MTESRPRSTPLRLGVIFSILGLGPQSEPVVYHGVQMRSMLEQDFAVHLDRQGIAWSYEPRRFGGYLPDFEITLGTRPCYVELKPTIAQGEAAKSRMEAIWDADPSAFLVVACAEGSTFFGANQPGGWTSWNERWSHS